MAALRIFSGIQPTGRKHLGNYIGAIRQYVEGQDRGEGIYCIVDLHATTVAYDPAELRERLYDTTAILIAAGLDPERCILFRQSDVKEPTSRMSTTYGSEQGTVYILDEADAVRKKVRSAVTDSGTEVRRAPDKAGITNLIDIISVIRDVPPEEVEREFDGSGYGDFKGA